MVQTATHQWISFTSKPKRTEQNLIVCTRKSEAEGTNNKRLRSMYCTVEANLQKGMKRRTASLQQQSYLL